jgi:hypothetical protein
MAIDPSWERRREHRLTVPATAVLFLEGVELGQFAVDNLSPAGALFTGDLGVARGERVSVLLTIPEASPLELDARVARSSRLGATFALGVEFEHWSAFTEDALRELIVGAKTASELPPTSPGLPELWEMDDPELIEVVPPPPRG